MAHLHQKRKHGVLMKTWYYSFWGTFLPTPQDGGRLRSFCEDAGDPASDRETRGARECAAQ
jgi:hypothetical protein